VGGGWVHGGLRWLIWRVIHLQVLVHLLRVVVAELRLQVRQQQHFWLVQHLYYFLHFRLLLRLLHLRCPLRREAIHSFIHMFNLLHLALRLLLLRQLGLRGPT